MIVQLKTLNQIEKEHKKNITKDDGDVIIHLTEFHISDYNNGDFWRINKKMQRFLGKAINVEKRAHRIYTHIGTDPNNHWWWHEDLFDLEFIKEMDFLIE